MATIKKPAVSSTSGVDSGGNSFSIPNGSSSVPANTKTATTPKPVAPSSAPTVAKFLDGSGVDAAGNPVQAIKKTDTPIGVAAKNGITVPALAAANKDNTGNKLTIPVVDAKLTPPPTIQNTAATRAANQKALTTYNEILASQGMVPPTTPGGTPTPGTPSAGFNGATPATPPTPTTAPPAAKVDPKSAISQLYLSGVTDPKEIYNQLAPTVSGLDANTVASEVSTLNSDADSFATGTQNAEIKRQLTELDKSQAEFDVNIAKMKQTLDAENSAAVDSIQANSEQSRNLLKSVYDTNQANTNKANYALDAFRYTTNQANGELAASESNFVVQMSSINAQEKGLLLQAAQAKSNNDWKLLDEKVTQYNNTQSQKRSLIGDMIQVSTTHLQNIQKAKDDAQKLATVNAPALVAELETYDTQDKKDAYIESKAKELGVSVDTLNSVLQGQIADNAKNNEPISNVMLEASKNGADAATLQKISNAKTVPEAIIAAGSYLAPKPTAADYAKSPEASGFSTPPQGGFRTDRNNNPVAMTTDVAKSLGLVEGQDYIQGDKFPGNSNLYTAKLLGDPINTVIKGLDNAAATGKGAFRTQAGKPRWSYIDMSDAQWNALTPEEKKATVIGMYQKEGGSGQLAGVGGAATAGSVTTYEQGDDGKTYKVTRKDGKVTNKVEQKTSDAVPSNVIDLVGSNLAANTGKAKGDPNGDSYISAEDYNDGLQQWLGQGYSADSYFKNYKRFINPDHAEDYNYYPPGGAKDSGGGVNSSSLLNNPGLSY